MQNANTYSGMERLSGDYNRGYTQAILDIQEVFNYINNDLISHHKKLNSKLADKLLKCILQNRELLRESKHHTDTLDEFIRYNKALDDFEYYKPINYKKWKPKYETKTKT